MRTSVIISIPEPCHEDWNKMTAKGKGRHCEACKKTVIDFTTKTDEQIIKTFEASKNLCGRFKTQQLNREMVLDRKDKNNYLSWAASGLFAFMALGSQNANAQGAPKTVQTDTVKFPQIKGKMATSILNHKVVTGTVTTASDGLPLPGASILIKGTALGAQTDFDGKFSIKAKVGNILVISFVGMEPQEIVISNKANRIDIAIDEGETLDEVGIVGGIISYWDQPLNPDDYEAPFYASETERQKSQDIRAYNKKWRERNKARRTKWRNERLLKREAIKSGEQKRTFFGKFLFSIKSLFSKK